jgi:hypothetical protein
MKIQTDDQPHEALYKFCADTEWFRTAKTGVSFCGNKAQYVTGAKG